MTSYTFVIRSSDATSKSPVNGEGNSDFSINIPAVIPQDNTSQRFMMSLRSVGIDVTDLAADMIEVHVDVSTAQNFYDSKVNSASTLVGVCSVSIATAIDLANNEHLQYPNAELITNFVKVVGNPNYSTIRVRYVAFSSQNTLTKTTNTDISSNFIVLEFIPI